MTTVAHATGCETVDVIPAKVIVKVRVDETVACPKDDTIVSAPTPPAIVEAGKLGDTLIVEATSDKYLDHMAIERQCSRFARRGDEIAPPSLRRSVSVHIDLLVPVANLIARTAHRDHPDRAIVITAIGHGDRGRSEATGVLGYLALA